MARIVILGGGLCGLSAGLMLARDGHAVSVLERDAAPVPDSPERAWADWRRAGVPHFKQPHGLQPRARSVLDRELPDVVAACLDAGATVGDPLDFMPPDDPRPAGGAPATSASARCRSAARCSSRRSRGSRTPSRA